MSGDCDGAMILETLREIQNSLKSIDERCQKIEVESTQATAEHREKIAQLEKKVTELFTFHNANEKIRASIEKDILTLKSEFGDSLSNGLKRVEKTLGDQIDALSRELQKNSTSDALAKKEKEVRAAIVKTALTCTGIGAAVASAIGAFF